MLMLLFISFIIIIIGFILPDIKDEYTTIHTVYPERENIKCILLKINKRKFDSIILFKDINNEKEYVLKLKKSYLNEQYIPNEFKILNSQKKSYYKHLTELLDKEKIFMIIYGKNKYNEYFLLSAKKITEDQREPVKVIYYK